MYTKNTVFAKKKTNTKVLYKSILKTIPKNSYKTEQINKKDMVESRWRFLAVPYEKNGEILVKQVVEISRKKPEEEREYLNNNINWIYKKIDKSYDQFVKDQYYYYSID